MNLWRVPSCAGLFRGVFIRIVRIDRSKRTSALPLPDGAQFDWAEIVALLDQEDVPDGTPFLIDDDGNPDALRRVNAYLLEAARQKAYAGDSLYRTHAYVLRRIIAFVRTRHGHVDLTAVTRADLQAYKTTRKPQLAPTTWNGEISIIGSFLHYAVLAGWIDTDPTPRWGTRQRNTLLDRVVAHRRERFLTAPQARLFLTAGLRGDNAVPPILRPKYAERDYLFGLLLLATGLRREEACLVLDCEIPNANSMHPSGVHTFTRQGKGGRPREVWITDTLVDVVDLYRATDRTTIVNRAQRRLRKHHRQGELLMIDAITYPAGKPTLIIDGRKVLAEHLTDPERTKAAIMRPDGTIEPLALIVVEGGLPPAKRTLNNIFNDASARIADLDDAARPPEHLTVTPHVMRHTFAVSMLAALMQEGRDRHGNPYHLLASPTTTIQQLLGHADASTTQVYLFAAERYSEEIPAALRMVIASTIGIPGGRAPQGDDGRADQ